MSEPRSPLSEIWSALTDLAVSLLETWGKKRMPITKKAMAVALKPKEYLEKLGF